MARRNWASVSGSALGVGAAGVAVAGAGATFVVFPVPADVDFVASFGVRFGADFSVADFAAAGLAVALRVAEPFFLRVGPGVVGALPFGVLVFRVFGLAADRVVAFFCTFRFFCTFLATIEPFRCLFAGKAENFIVPQ